MKRVKSSKVQTVKKLTILTLLNVLTLSPLCAKSAGRTSGNFLSLGAGARQIAMGETGAAISGDVHASYWNPAGLVSIKSPELALMHHRHFAGIDSQYATFTRPCSFGTPAVSLTRLNIGSMASYNSAGAKTGTVEAGDWALGLAFGKEILKRFDAGLGIKWIRETLGPVGAQTFAIDTGFVYRPSAAGHVPFLDKMRFGASYANAGGNLKFDSQRFPLPRMLRLGAVYEDKIKIGPTMVALESVWPQYGAQVFSAGAEWQPAGFLAVRAGYRGGQKFGSGLRLVCGLKLGNMAFDYAWAGFGDLGASHRFGVRFIFSGD
ncbi:MAG: PorV/PorQ family protein [Elusimicrobia bacterium]|nr:PorV/PorQ family protein [Elusimicrobiota bacterium]